MRQLGYSIMTRACNSVVLIGRKRVANIGKGRCGWCCEFMRMLDETMTTE